MVGWLIGQRTLVRKPICSSYVSICSRVLYHCALPGRLLKGMISYTEITYLVSAHPLYRLYSMNKSKKIFIIYIYGDQELSILSVHYHGQGEWLCTTVIHSVKHRHLKIYSFLRQGLISFDDSIPDTKSTISISF